MKLNSARWSRLTVRLFAFAALYWISDLIFIPLFRMLKGIPGAAEPFKLQLLVIHSLILGFTCALAGFVRFGSRHPIGHRRYRAWLGTTPWTAKLPLPLGDVRLEFIDTIILIAACVLAKYTTILQPLLPLILFGIGYSLAALFAFSRTNISLWKLLAFGLIALIRTWDHPNITLAIVIANLLIVWIGLPESLENASWVGTLSDAKNKQSWNSFSEPKFSLGWPLQQIGPRSVGDGMSVTHILVTSLLVGFFAYCLSYRIIKLFPQDANDALLTVALLGGFAAFLRLVIYIARHAAPLTFFGRLFTGNWIIPTYDQVYITPLLVLCVAIFAGLIKTPNHERIEIYAGIFSTAIIAIALAGPPSYKSWHYTGGHAIRHIRQQTRQATIT